MPDALCKPCKDRGRTTVAHRIVAGTPMCSACFKGADPGVDPVISAALERKEAAKPMPMKVTKGKRRKIDWQAVQRDRDAGASAAELAIKYDLQKSAIYMRTKAGRAAPPKKSGRSSTGPIVCYTKDSPAAVAENPFALQIRTIPLDQIPGGVTGQTDPEYQALWMRLLACEDDQGIVSRIPAAAKKSKAVRGAIRSALVRLARRDGKKVRFICHIRGALVYLARESKK